MPVVIATHDTDFNYPPEIFMNLFEGVPRLRTDYLIDSFHVNPVNPGFAPVLSIELSVADRAFDKLLVGGEFTIIPYGKDQNAAYNNFGLFNLATWPVDNNFFNAGFIEGRLGEPIYPTGVMDLNLGAFPITRIRWDMFWAFKWQEVVAANVWEQYINKSKFMLCTPMSREKPIFLNAMLFIPIAVDEGWYVDFRFYYYVGKFKSNVVI
jgi:hypothetical protein